MGFYIKTKKSIYPVSGELINTYSSKTNSNTNVYFNLDDKNRVSFISDVYDEKLSPYDGLIYQSNTNNKKRNNGRHNQLQTIFKLVSFIVIGSVAYITMEKSFDAIGSINCAIKNGSTGTSDLGFRWCDIGQNGTIDYFY